MGFKHDLSLQLKFRLKIFRLVICTIVRTEEKLNVVLKMKCVKQIGLQLMTRLESISQDPNIHIHIKLFKMTNRSYNFLTKNKEFLDNWVKLGHDTCHKIQGYDAEKCHKDCKKLEKSDFAKECKKDGGLFKCCIR